MKRHIVFTHRIHAVNTFPELALALLVAGCKKVNIIKHTVVTVILDMQQTRALRLNPHVDVFGNQTHKLARVLYLVLQGHVDDAIIVSLILRAIEKRHVLVSAQ